MTIRHYQLPLPYGRPPKALWGNTRQHWINRSKQSKQVRGDVMMVAKHAKVPVSTHLTVCLTWAPGDRRKRDSDNLWPMLKACCDGLARGKRKDWVGLELVPDDTPAFMTKQAPIILGPDQCPVVGMWLDVWAECGPPRCFIDGYWHVSTDEGITWTREEVTP
jgi:crossover junction endodeoxyribonuclease RusA